MKGYRKVAVLFGSMVAIIVLAAIGAPPEAFTTLGYCTILYYVATGGKQFAEAWKGTLSK